MKTAQPSDQDMINVTVRIMGREYTVACARSEHESLVTSADFLNERMSAVRIRGKALGAERIAVMVALNLAREVLDLRGTEGVTQGQAQETEQVRQMILDIDSTLVEDDS